MRWKFVWRRPILTLTQFLALMVVLFGLFVALDLNRRAQAGRLVGKDEETLKVEVEAELTRQVELQVTREFVISPEYPDKYAHEEAGMVLDNEKIIVPLFIEAAPRPSLPIRATPDPAQLAHPWQVWWQLLTDIPMPTE